MAGVNTVASTDLETHLYRPVKRFLEQLGFVVKGEIEGCDLVGIRDDDRVVIIGELTLRFNLEYFCKAWIGRVPATRSGWLSALARGGTIGRRIRVSESSVVCWGLVYLA